MFLSKALLLGGKRPPPDVGEVYNGGYFFGQIMDAGVIYNLILAPRASGEDTGKVYAPTSAASAARQSRTNGPSNTANMLLTGTAAAAFCNDLVIGGYDDWYLPAIDELEMLYRAFKPTTGSNIATGGNGTNVSSVPAGAAYTTTDPAQTTISPFGSGQAEVFSGAYWSSTEGQATTAYRMNFSNADSTLTPVAKTASSTVRAIRREAI